VVEVCGHRERLGLMWPANGVVDTHDALCDVSGWQDDLIVRADVDVSAVARFPSTRFTFPLPTLLARFHNPPP